MNPTDLQDGRYLLLLDILGFRDLVAKQTPDHIYGIVDAALESFDRWEKSNNQFRTVYYSDTILFYQQPRGYGNWAFLDVYGVSALLVASLLARAIPARGSISFGEFVNRKDGRKKHDIFFASSAEFVGEFWLG